MTLLAIARLFLFVREASANAGQRVEAIQKWCGGQKGESWCCYFVTLVLDLYYQGTSPVPRLGACEDVHQLAKRNGWIVDEPEPGDVVLSVNASGHAHHIGFCTVSTPLATIAGNTSEDGASSNGERVAEHPVSRTGKVFVRLPH